MANLAPRAARRLTYRPQSASRKGFLPGFLRAMFHL